MTIVKGICIILGFLTLGEVCSILINHFIPGSVLGMILLFLALTLKIVKPESIRSVAEFLTKNMAIFFLPAFMGIMDQWGLISLNLGGWLIVMFASTIAVFFTSGWEAKTIIRFNERREKK